MVCWLTNLKSDNLSHVKEVDKKLEERPFAYVVMIPVREIKTYI
jgi:hypothetical protein